MEELNAAAAATEPPARLSVLLIDVDGLKLANDTVGHDVGDRLLVTVAEALKAELREDDLAARLAGDEFVALLRYTNGAEAMAIAQRLEDAITKAAQRATGLQDVGASVGWAEYGANGHDPDELLSAADRSMYATKRHHYRRAGRRIEH
jgi:diguanylate cyclase (GGDEF)-like protein